MGNQYCRYCANCFIRDEDVFVCIDESGHSPEKWLNGKQIRRENKCKRFVFNEMAVDNPECTYKPDKTKKQKREFREKNQISFLEPQEPKRKRKKPNGEIYACPVCNSYRPNTKEPCKNNRCRSKEPAVRIYPA